MLSRISKKIAYWCYAGTNRGDVEITAYGIELILDTSSKLLALMFLAFFVGYLQQTLIALIVFSSLRFFAGGMHWHSGWGCFFSMFFILGMTVGIQRFIIVYQLVLPQNLLGLMLLMLTGLVFLYAPATTLNNPIKDRHIIKKKKLCSILLSVLLSFVIWYVPNYIRFLFFVPFLFEVITILPIVNYKTTREEDHL